MLASCSKKDDPTPEKKNDTIINDSIIIGMNFDSLEKTQVKAKNKNFAEAKGDTIKFWKITDSTEVVIGGKTIWTYSDSTDMVINGITKWIHTDSTSKTIGETKYWIHKDSTQEIIIKKPTYAILDSAINQITEQNIKNVLLPEVMNNFTKSGDLKVRGAIFADCKLILDAKLTVNAINKAIQDNAHLSIDEIFLKILMGQKATLVATAKRLYPPKS